MATTTHDLTPDQAVWQLMEGHFRFKEGKSAHPHQRIDEWTAKTDEAKEQHPYAVILGCADSRVPPEIIFDCSFGDLFVVRVAGNVYDDDDAVQGSIEYAVTETGHMKVPLVVVLGHERCGAVKAARDAVKAFQANPTEAKNKRAMANSKDPLDKLVAKIWDAAERTEDKDETKWLDKAVRENVNRVKDKLTTAAFAADEVKKGNLKILGARYHLDTGGLEIFDDTHRKLPKSPDSNVQVTVTFRNQRSSNIIVYWNNFVGNLELSCTLKPGESYTGISYTGHIFTAFDGFQQVKTTYIASREKPEWIISKP